MPQSRLYSLHKNVVSIRPMMSVFLKTAVLFCVLALARSQSTPVSACIYHSGELPVNIYVENCPTPPCQLPQLQDVVLNIIVKAPRTMRSMQTLATAYLFGPIGIPYNLGAEALTCNFLTNTYCPVLEGEVFQYTLRMFIESWFPVGTSVTIEFRIVDENNTPVVCVRVPISITQPLSLSGSRNGTLVVNAADN